MGVCSTPLFPAHPAHSPACTHTGTPCTHMCMLGNAQDAPETEALNKLSLDIAAVDLQEIHSASTYPFLQGFCGPKLEYSGASARGRTSCFWPCRAGQHHASTL